MLHWFQPSQQVSPKNRNESNFELCYKKTVPSSLRFMEPTLASFHPRKKNTGRPQTIETFAVIKAILYCLTRLDWHMFRFSWEAFNCNQQLHLFWEKYRFSVGFQKASIYSRTPELWLEWNTKSSIYRGGGVQVFTRWWSRDDFFPSRVFFPAKHRSTASLHLFTLP